MSAAALVVMCGVSFAGKSTLASRLGAVLPAQVVSLDEINSERGIHGGDGIPIGEWATTHGLARQRAADLLVAGITVVVDDTTSRRFLRDEWRATAASAGVRSVLVWVTVHPDDQRRRVESNRGSHTRPDVVDAVMREHLSGFEAPDDDERALIVDSAVPLERQAALVADAVRA